MSLYPCICAAADESSGRRDGDVYGVATIRLVRARFQKVLEPGRRRRAVRRSFAREAIRELSQLPAVLGEGQSGFHSVARWLAALCLCALCLQIDPNRGIQAISSSVYKRVPELALAKHGCDPPRTDPHTAPSRKGPLSAGDVSVSLTPGIPFVLEAEEQHLQLSTKDSDFGDVTLKPQKKKGLMRKKQEDHKGEKEEKKAKKDRSQKKEQGKKLSAVAESGSPSEVCAAAAEKGGSQ